LILFAFFFPASSWAVVNIVTFCVEASFIYLVVLLGDWEYKMLDKKMLIKMLSIGLVLEIYICCLIYLHL
jgi:hypothetical protein